MNSEDFLGESYLRRPISQGPTANLDEPVFEKDSCGLGLVVAISGQQSRGIVDQALRILASLAHRGAQGADGATGDGAGLLTQIPYRFLSRFFPDIDEGDLVAQLMLPRNSCLASQTQFSNLANELGLSVSGWREVPINSSVLGAQARATEPTQWQVVLRVDRSSDGTQCLKTPGEVLRISSELREKFEFSSPGAWVSSLSCKTIVYKALVLPGQLAEYFPDLKEPQFMSAMAMVHSRFSTNTLPAWHLAHPFRWLCHNGEINTISGNRHWLSSRFAMCVPTGLSDSASLDRAAEVLMIANQISLPDALHRLIPEAWEQNHSLDSKVRDHYQKMAALQEPWDGPAAVAFADGDLAGALLDRNGLRPCRYVITKAGEFILSSEVGVLGDLQAIERGRLGPGGMIIVDTVNHRVLKNSEVKLGLASEFAKTFPSHSSWVMNSGSVESSILSGESPRYLSSDQNFELMRLFGYSEEELVQVLEPMIRDGEEATSSMGSDTPLALLSDKPQLLFKYFRQNFAQVTNPPIDPIREKSVMSLTTYIGSKLSGGSVLALKNPVLSHQEFLQIGQLKTKILSTLFEIPSEVSRSLGLQTGGKTSSEIDRLLDQVFASHLKSLQLEAIGAANAGVEVLILSDRGAKANRYAVPILLALSAVHTALSRGGKRLALGLVCETAEARDIHHMACLFGYGCEAIYPYLVESYIHSYIDQRRELEPTVGPGIGQDIGFTNYQKALAKGLLKVLSKMGISTLQSYCGAHLFEALGISSQVVDEYFPETPSRIGGLSLGLIAEEVIRRHQQVDQLPQGFLHAGGEVHYRVQGEEHLWSPRAIANLQLAARENSSKSFREFSREVNRLSAFTLRGFLKPRPSLQAMALELVEPARELVKHFTTGAMSFGALGKEAHETLAVAMNRMGAKSNSGEGGEDPERFKPVDPQTWKNSAIKQVASARFGVTAHYLINASELQIKMAQGAKPGEGGQLPGPKVDAAIAKMRYSTPGVTLISPPPHHDIYSIEDLAQLIYDLRTINPKAEISVKLVSSPGVGTIAAGVAKAKADKILIAGDGGGTGASPLSSIKSAGSPWELGLAEAQQTLVRHALRERVKVEVDGQLRNGRDVIVAALLGAEEFGFSTAPLIAEGCIMMRKCHLNTCPVGVATQDPELRKLFSGQPEHVINYFFFVAEEVREYLALLGVRTLKEIVGRRDLLDFLPVADHWKRRTLNLSRLLAEVRSEVPGFASLLHQKQRWNHPIDDFHQQLVLRCLPALSEKKPVYLKNTIANHQRSVGARLSGEVAWRHEAEGLPPKSIHIQFEGVAGQSFGAFLARGICFELFGEANDYIGKSLSGGVLAIRPRENDTCEGVIAGNTCFYGATSGEGYIRGSVGERFAVRNSGAQLVVEGVGDHGCEYMTGGEVVVIGETGVNFAAGMSGGYAFVYDSRRTFRAKCNLEMVDVESLAEEFDHIVYTLLEKHVVWTESPLARDLIVNWKNAKKDFVQVLPREFRRIRLQTKNKGQL